MSLKSELKDAKIVVKDSKKGYTLAWFGGHGVHAYDSSGREIAFWNVGSFASDNASEKDVRESMDDLIRDGNYEDYG